MIKQLDGYYIFNIPIEWGAIYKYLLTQISNQAIDVLKDCNGACSSKSSSILKCWNIFQIACAAYEKQEYIKANTLLQVLFNDCSCLRGKFKIEDFIVSTEDEDLESKYSSIKIKIDTLSDIISTEDLYNAVVETFSNETNPNELLRLFYECLKGELIKGGSCVHNNQNYNCTNVYYRYKSNWNGSTKYYIYDDDDLYIELYTNKNLIAIKLDDDIDVKKVWFNEDDICNVIYDEDVETNEFFIEGTIDQTEDNKRVKVILFNKEDEKMRKIKIQLKYI